MSDIDWANAIDVIKDHTVKIATPRGSGTGFLVTYRHTRQLYGIATAYHVIQHAHGWGEPIRLTHASSGVSHLFNQTERAILPLPERDLAVVLFSDSTLGLPTEPLTLAPPDKYLRPATEIGWLGYPAVAINELCFFQGVVSCFLQQTDCYLVDGVAINRVSGGPAFSVFNQSKTIHLVGLVSAYIANRAAGDVLPGVCMVTGIFPYHDMIAQLKSLDEARAKEQEMATQQAIEVQQIERPQPPTGVGFGGS